MWYARYSVLDMGVFSETPQEISRLDTLAAYKVQVARLGKWQNSATSVELRHAK